jgi:hypothetical protein
MGCRPRCSQLLQIIIKLCTACWATSSEGIAVMREMATAVNNALTSLAALDTALSRREAREAELRERHWQQAGAGYPAQVVTP